MHRCTRTSHPLRKEYRVIRSALQSQMAQAAVLGESQEKIIKRIQKVTGQAEYQARRIAQT